MSAIQLQVDACVTTYFCVPPSGKLAIQGAGKARTGLPDLLDFFVHGCILYAEVFDHISNLGCAVCHFV